MNYVQYQTSNGNKVLLPTPVIPTIINIERGCSDEGENDEERFSIVRSLRNLMDRFLGVKNNTCNEEEYSTQITKLFTAENFSSPTSSSIYKNQDNTIKSANYLKNDQFLHEFFDFLIPDWRFRNKSVTKYDLITKNKVVLGITGFSIALHMKDLIKSREKSFYHFIAMSILWQFYFEENKSNNIDLFKLYNTILCENLENKPFKATTELHPSMHDDRQFSSEDGPIRDEKFDIFLSNAYWEILETNGPVNQTCLRNFLKYFKLYVTTEKQKCGAYYIVSLKQMATIYFDCLKSNGLFKLAQFVLQMFPNIDENYSLVTGFHEKRCLKIIDTGSLYTKELMAVYKPILHYRVLKKLLNLGHISILSYNKEKKKNQSLKYLVGISILIENFLFNNE